MIFLEQLIRERLPQMMCSECRYVGLTHDATIEAFSRGEANCKHPRNMDERGFYPVISLVEKFQPNWFPLLKKEEEIET